MGPTPDAHVGATPQGLTTMTIQGVTKLVLTTAYDKAIPEYQRLSSKVFIIDPAADLPMDKLTMSLVPSAVFPNYYRHVSGVTMDGNMMLFVDYVSGSLIEVNYAKIFQGAEVDVISIRPTKLKGPSATEMFYYNSEQFLAISDFSVINANQPTTIFNFSNCDFSNVECRYRTGGRSQGLAFMELEDKPMLIEAVNKGVIDPFVKFAGKTDLINFYNLESLASTEPSRRTGPVYQFKSPGKMVEDITWDPRTERLYVTDELTKHFYAGELIVESSCNK